MRHVGLFCITFLVIMLFVLVAFMDGIMSALSMTVAYIVLTFLGILVLSKIITNTNVADAVVHRPITTSPLSKMILSSKVLRILIVINIGVFVSGYGLRKMHRSCHV